MKRVNGLLVSFTRRRYGRRVTYTWAHIEDEHGNRLGDLGDPWPGVNWPKAELEREVMLWQARQQAQTCEAHVPNRNAVNL